jgi:hypothetical protein
MPDPQQKSEIMDVLSSIRRLVSEGRNMADKAEPSEKPKAHGQVEDSGAGDNGAEDNGAEDSGAEVTGASSPAADQNDGRLVLTPALRVARPAQEGAGDDAVANGATDQGPDPRALMAQVWARDAEAETAGDAPKVAATPTLEDTIAELEAAVAEIETGFEPDGGDAEDMSGDQLSDAIWDDDPIEDAALFVAPDKAASDRAAPDEVAPDEVAAEEAARDESAEDGLADETPAEDLLARGADMSGPAVKDMPSDRPIPGFHGIMAGYDILADRDERLDAPITADAPQGGPPPPPGDYGRSASVSDFGAPDMKGSQEPSLFRRARSGDLDHVPLAEFADPELPGPLADEAVGDDDAASVEEVLATDGETAPDDTLTDEAMADDVMADEAMADEAAPDEAMPDEAAPEDSMAGPAEDRAHDEDALPGDNPDEADVEVAAEAGAMPDRPDEDETAADPQADSNTDALGPEGAAVAPEATPHGQSRLTLGPIPGTRPHIYRQAERQHAEEGDLTLDAGNGAGHDPADGDGTDLFDPLSATDIDLEALRDVVAEVIREELRGTLGERITRNLRLLVRREIARALEAERTDDPAG